MEEAGELRKLTKDRENSLEPEEGVDIPSTSKGQTGFHAGALACLQGHAVCSRHIAGAHFRPHKRTRRDQEGITMHTWPPHRGCPCS